MQLVYGHVWALWWWRLTRVDVTADSLRTNICTLDKAPTKFADLEKAGVFDTRKVQVDRGTPRDLPTEILSKDDASHTRLSLAKIRRWNGPVRIGSLCTAGDHLVCAPEFCFVLIAHDIRRICQERLESWQYAVVLAELGCELCGTYSKLDTRRGFKNRDIQLVGAWRMRDFACGVAHMRGAACAYETLRWVMDGLNSPMETAVYLMLCLPSAWGGLAFERPCANVSLAVPRELWSKTAARHILPDLYWQERGLAVEFFGEEFHLGRERQDRERQETEQDMGLKVVSFWKEDVLDLRRFNAKAATIARYLGQPPRATDKGFASRQFELQQMLVRHQRWV